MSEPLWAYSAYRKSIGIHNSAVVTTGSREDNAEVFVHLEQIMKLHHIFWRKINLEISCILLNLLVFTLEYSAGACRVFAVSRATHSLVFCRSPARVCVGPEVGIRRRSCLHKQVTGSGASGASCSREKLASISTASLLCLRLSVCAPFPSPPEPASESGSVEY